LNDPIITVDEVTKQFRGGTRALDGLSLTIPKGTVYGLLGPNGAGKTTLIRILAILLRPDSGTVRVAGHDAVRNPARVRERIGLAGQFAAVDDHLTGRENIAMIGRLYGLSRREAARRAADIVHRIHLADAADRQVKTYSGGMRRRIDLAASLIGRPQVLFLDEPTTGVDPASRQDLWHLVRDLAAEGTTVLLTTQYLDEADQLADRIAVIDHGRLLTEGTATELKDRTGGILAQSAVFGSAPTAYGLNNDRTNGVLDRFRSLPMARSAVLTGRTLSDLTRNTFILGLQLAVGVALGFRWQNGPGGMLAAMGVALAFGYACCWLMAYLGLTIRNTEAIQAAIYMVVFPMTLTSSVFLPTQTMPGWLQAFAEHQPITITANALRGLTLGQGALPAGHTVTGETLLALTWTVGILAVFAPLAVRAYQRNNG
jgi:ABC transporter DrrB family efflux protein